MKPIGYAEEIERMEAGVCHALAQLPGDAADAASDV